MATDWKAPTPETLWRGSDLDSRADEAASLYGTSTVAARSAAPSAVAQLGSLTRMALLAASAAASAGLAVAGFALLAWLLLTRGLTPPQREWVRPLDLDYSLKHMDGRTAFLPMSQLADGLIPEGLPAGTRFLDPGTVVDVWVDLTITASSAGGMVQVAGELQSADGRPVGRASRAVPLHRVRHWPGRGLLTSAARWLGLLPDARTVHVRLFSAYREKEAQPFLIFSGAVRTRDGSGWAPEVLSAAVRVSRRMNPLRRALYELRPHPYLSLLAGLMAVAWLAGGSALSISCLVALIFYATRPAAAGGAPAASESAGGSGAREEDELSSVSGDVSEADSAELLVDSPPRAGSPPPSPPPSSSAAAAAALAAAAAKGGGFGGGSSSQGRGPTLDSAYGGSEASAAVRRRMARPSSGGSFVSF